MARVLLTGGNGGIGLATTLLLAEHGHTVLPTVRSPDKAAFVTRAAVGAGVGERVAPMVVDIGDEEDRTRALTGIDVDVLVLNAAYTNNGTVEDVPMADVRRHLEVNLLAPAAVAQLALPAMRARGSGRIVAVSSVLATVSLPLWAWYDASKRALEATMESLRMEVASAGITVALVRPGATRTGIYQREREELAARSTVLHRTAYERWCRATRLLEPLMTRPPTIARTIVRAVEDDPPRRVYQVGRGAVIGTRLLRMTPTPVRERLLRTPLGL